MVAAITLSFGCYTGYIVQQEKTNGGSADDPKDMCLHVDDRNGTSVVILDNKKN